MQLCLIALRAAIMFIEFRKTPSTRYVTLLVNGKQKLENLGIDPSASRMLSERSTI